MQCGIFGRMSPFLCAGAASFFCATVECATIGGLGTCCLTPTLLRRLEGSIAKRLRLLLRGDARYRSNNWVRAQCHCYTITSLLLVARLKFLRSVLCMQGDVCSSDSALPSLLLGSSRMPGSNRLSITGSPVSHCNPWLAMFAADVASAVDAGALPPMPLDVNQWQHVPEFRGGTF